MVVFIDEEIHFLSGTLACLIDELQLRYSSAFGVQFFPGVRGEEVGIFLTKTLDGSTAVFIQPFAVIIQLAADTGKVEIEHEVAISVRCGGFTNVEATKEVIELIAGVYIVVVLQYVQCQALAEASRTDEEKETIRLFYQGDKAGFVYIIIVFAANNRKVHHSVGKSLSVRYYIFQWIHFLSSYYCFLICCFVA